MIGLRVNKKKLRKQPFYRHAIIRDKIIDSFIKSEVNLEIGTAVGLSIFLEGCKRMEMTRDQIIKYVDENISNAEAEI